MLLSLKTKMVPSSCAPRKTPFPKIILLHKIFALTAFVISIIPHIWVLGIMGLAVRAWLYLGHWPRPSHPDPKHLPFELHHAALWQVFEFVKWSIVIMPAIYLITRFLVKAKLPGRPLRIYLWGWAAVIFMIFVPPFDFVNWFMD